MMDLMMTYTRQVVEPSTGATLFDLRSRASALATLPGSDAVREYRGMMCTISSSSESEDNYPMLIGYAATGARR